MKLSEKLQDELDRLKYDAALCPYHIELVARLEEENAVLIKRLWDYEHIESDERIRDEK